LRRGESRRGVQYRAIKTAKQHELLRLATTAKRPAMRVDLYAGSNKAFPARCASRTRLLTTYTPALSPPILSVPRYVNGKGGSVARLPRPISNCRQILFIANNLSSLPLFLRIRKHSFTTLKYIAVSADYLSSCWASHLLAGIEQLTPSR
jgi:hypothetical protein